jgi:methylated-DNA-[protein]-cysteine S-methyltransferase
MNLYTTTFDSPVGPLFCAVDEAGTVVRIEFGRRRSRRPPEADLAAAGHRLVEDRERTRPLREQLDEYFAGRRRRFDLPLAPAGTPFQRQVWEALAAIPYGETRTYGEVARSLGRPDASRAVGAANGANPLPIVIPCHRVVGSDGSLTGFGGGLETKSALLELERGQGTLALG